MLNPIDWIKRWGIRKAIQELDNAEAPLGDWIEKQRQYFVSLNSQEMAKALVDKFQDWLKEKFNVQDA